MEPELSSVIIKLGLAPVDAVSMGFWAGAVGGLAAHRPELPNNMSEQAKPLKRGSCCCSGVEVIMVCAP